MDKVQRVKDLISSSESKIMSVKFKKADGSLRPMVFNPKTAKGLKGDSASPSAKQAVATRKKLHPNLVSVCDQSLLAKGDPAERCWRSINCETVTEVHVNGQVFYYE